MSQEKKPASPLLQELQDIINGLPSMAKNFSGMDKVLKFIAKVVMRTDTLDARVRELEERLAASTKTDA